MNPILTLKKSLLFLSAGLLFFACASSTGSRYETNEKSKTSDNSTTVEKKDEVSLPKEEFDITPYKTEISIPEKRTFTGKEDIWIDYGSKEAESNTKTLIGTEDGYRVLILTTDNSEEANQVRTDIYFSKNANEVYVDFEPPFYKVKVGDFDSQKNADDFRFKLNQLGYKEAKVIREKINIYK